jgi:hypothetical protein
MSVTRYYSGHDSSGEAAVVNEDPHCFVDASGKPTHARLLPVRRSQEQGFDLSLCSAHSQNGANQDVCEASIHSCSASFEGLPAL